MRNSDIQEAIGYHEETKHLEVSVRTKASFLDWENKPVLYKMYASLSPISLPMDFHQPQQDTIDCVSIYEANAETVDLGKLAELLHFTAGITKKIRFATGEVYPFRAAAATGALYEVEVYVVCGEIRGLEAGVYHFNPQDFALRQLRRGDYRSFSHEASGKIEKILTAPVTLIFTAIYWRNAWKYQARSYRHFFWDSGTMIANLLATAASAELGTRVILGFVDEYVNRLLGLDTKHEATLVLVAIGSEIASSTPLLEFHSLEEISHEYRPFSKKEVEYPEVLRMHSASSLESPEEVALWRARPPSRRKPQARGTLHPLQALQSRPSSPLGKTILRRGSSRQFSREPIPVMYLSTILQSSTRGIPADFLVSEQSTLVEVYLIANAINGIEQGAYYFDQEQEALELLRTGDFRKMSGYLCLEQQLAADGSVAIFLMSNLNSVLETYGNRGYRAAQLEAGITAGKMYLAAYALGIGASGITFYDDAVTDFFSPHAMGKSNMLSVILGVPAYRHKQVLGQT